MGNLNLSLPDEVHKRLKLLAVERGVPLKDLLVQALSSDRSRGRH